MSENAAFDVLGLGCTAVDDLLYVAAAALHEVVVEVSARAKARGRDDNVDRQVGRVLLGVLPGFVLIGRELPFDRDVLGEPVIDHAWRQIEHLVALFGDDDDEFTEVDEPSR